MSIIEQTSRRRRLYSGILLVVLAVASSSGCGGSETKTVPVSGTVSFDGQPLADGSLTFLPDASKGNSFTEASVGSIGPDGAYSLATGDQSGAPLGWYHVAVRASVPSNPDDPYSVPKSLIPEKYGAAETSGLSVEVVERPAPGAYDLRLSPGS